MENEAAAAQAQEQWRGAVEARLPSTPATAAWPHVADFFTLHRYLPGLDVSERVAGDGDCDTPVSPQVAVAALFPTVCRKNAKTFPRTPASTTPRRQRCPRRSSTHQAYEVIQEQLEDQDVEQFRRRQQLTFFSI